MILALIISSMVGLIANWLKMWSLGETKADFVDYMKAYKKHSIGSIITAIGAGITVSTSVAELTTNAIALAFLAGFAIDSTINKTPEQS
jgi:hypothetical protein